MLSKMNTKFYHSLCYENSCYGGFHLMKTVLNEVVPFWGGVRGKEKYYINKNTK